VSRTRKNHAAEQKVAILRSHLVEHVRVSDLCDELGLNLTALYGWQKQFFENGAAAFERTRGRQTDRRDQKIEKLEAKLAQKNEVLADLMQEHVALDKNLGNSETRLGAPRLLADGRRAAGDPGLRARVSGGRLPSSGVHDARRQRGGGWTLMGARPSCRMPRTRSSVLACERRCRVRWDVCRSSTDRQAPGYVLLRQPKAGWL